MVTQTMSRALMGFVLLKDIAQGVNIYVTNKCEESMMLAHVTPDGMSTDKLAAGDTVTKTIAAGTSSHVFKSGTGAQATLAEFSTMGGKTWVDISGIPTGPKSGPENCASLEACKVLTGGVGFNVAMQITPHTPDGNRCVQLTCMSDGCSDAYLFPKDDTKTHTCPLSTDFDLVFCPGGSGGSTSVTQSAPTPASAPSPTPSPTPAPTPAPTPVPLLAPASTPSPKEPTWSPPTKQTPSLTTNSSGWTGSDGLGQQNFVQSFKSPSLAGLEQENIVHSSKSAVLDPEAKADYGNLRKVNASSTTQQTAQTADDGTKQIGGQTPAVVSDKGDSVQQVTTRSETNSGNSIPYVVLCISGFVGMVAAAVIVVVRKKKAQLEELETKTPLSTTAHGSLANLRTPRNNVSVL